MKTEWKEILEFPGYFVSNKGVVKGPKGVKKTHLAKGYPKVCIGGKSWFIHRLVLTVFVGPSNGLHGAHLNGVRNDNRLENLKWCTRKENESHKFAHGTLMYEEKHPLCKLTSEAVDYIRRNAIIKRGSNSPSNVKALAEKYGVKEPAIIRVARGDRWKRHKTPPQRIKE